MPGDSCRTEPPDGVPSAACMLHPSAFLQENALQAFLKETIRGRLAKIGPIAEHVRLPPTEDSLWGRTRNDNDTFSVEAMG